MKDVLSILENTSKDSSPEIHRPKLRTAFKGSVDPWNYKQNCVSVYAQYDEAQVQIIH